MYNTPNIIVGYYLLHTPVTRPNFLFPTLRHFNLQQRDIGVCMIIFCFFIRVVESDFFFCNTPITESILLLARGIAT